MSPFRLAAPVCLATALLLAAGCNPVRKTHGYVPREGQLSELQIGSDSKAEVAGKIGRPTSVGTFDDDEWYYISRQTEARAFLEPKVLSQEVVVVAFDEKGVATAVDRYGLEDGRVVNLVTRTTPTRGKRLTFLQQLLGNIGRFSADDFTGGSRRPGSI